MNKVIMLLSAAVLLFAACDKDDDNPAPSTQTANLKLHFHPKVGMSDMTLNQPYTNGLNQNLSWSLSQFYISDVKLWADASGSQKVSIPNSYFLVKPNHADIDMGMVPTGKYYGIEFNVGIADSAVNHGDPSLQTGDLAPQNPSMHWSWNSGYIFIKIEGQYTTSAGAAPTKDFKYHVGMLSLAKEVTVAKQFEVVAGAGNTQMIMVDHLAMLQDVDFNVDTLTHTMNNMPLAMKIANNMPNSFK